MGTSPPQNTRTFSFINESPLNLRPQHRKNYFITHYIDWNKNGFSRLVYLDVWILIGRTVCEVLEDVEDAALLE